MPTMSLYSQPQTLSPVNAPLWFVGETTDSTFPFFKYIYNIYQYDRFTNDNIAFLGQYIVPPSFENNQGIIDIHKIIKSKVGEYNFSFTQSGLNGVIDNNCICKYQFSYGYQYNPNYRFIDTFSHSITETEQLVIGPSQSGASNPFTSNVQSVDGPNQITLDYNAGFYNLLFYARTYKSNTYFIMNGDLTNQYTVNTITMGSLGFPMTLIIDQTFSGSITTGVNTFTFYDTFVNNYVGLSFTYSNLLKANDIIQVQLDNNTSPNQSYNGLSTVQLELNATQSITDIFYNVQLPSAETGTITLIERNTGSASNAYAYDGTRQYDESNIDFGLTKSLSASASNFASSYIGDKQIYLNQFETVSLMCLDSSLLTNAFIRVKTFDINKQLLNSYVSMNTIGITQSFIKYELGTGTKNLQGWTMSGTPINLPTLGYYQIDIFNGIPSYILSKTYSIVNNCSVFNNIRIQFLTRDGGYDYWNFNYDSKYTLSINRTEYDRSLKWNYNMGDRGRSIMNVQGVELWTANTDWISESDYHYLQELITSQDVYIIDELTNLKYPINIEDTKYDLKTKLREKLFILTITYKYAYDLNL
jgi:hypothetical protein